MKKLIIELELLTPLKYKESMHVSNTGWGTTLEITEVYKENNTLSNCIIKKSTPIDLEGAEECLLIESSELHDKEFKNYAEFKGMHSLEGQYRPICVFVYKVKNPSEKVRDVLNVGGRRHMKYYVKRTNVDNETADVFSDIYNSL